MVNRSKMTDSRFWRKWYASGAVMQKDYPEGSLHIAAMGIHIDGPMEGFTTLSLGSRVVNSGPEWSVSEPLCAVVIPSNEKYRLNGVLSALPKNAVPVDVFFRK